MTTINKSCLIISSMICFYLRFISAYVIPKFGVIFFNDGDIVITETDLSNPQHIGSVSLHKAAKLDEVAHSDSLIVLYFVNPHDKFLTAVVIEKESVLIHDVIQLDFDWYVYHVLATPDNEILILDNGTSLVAYMQFLDFIKIETLERNYIFIDMFVDPVDMAVYYLISGPSSEMILQGLNVNNMTKTLVWTVRPPYAFENAFYDPIVRKIFFIIENMIIICPLDKPAFYTKFATATITSASMGLGYMIYRTTIEGVLYIFNTNSLDDAIVLTNYDHELMMGQILVYSDLDHSDTFYDIRKRETGPVAKISWGCSNPDIIHLTPLLIILHFKFALLHYG